MLKSPRCSVRPLQKHPVIPVASLVQVVGFRSVGFRVYRV